MYDPYQMKGSKHLQIFNFMKMKAWSHDHMTIIIIVMKMWNHMTIIVTFKKVFKRLYQ